MASRAGPDVPEVTPGTQGAVHLHSPVGPTAEHPCQRAGAAGLSPGLRPWHRRRGEPVPALGRSTMGRRPRIGVKGAAMGAAVALALLAGGVQAKSWKQWAPDPLASDSTYARFLARPADSLTAAQLSWLAVQRDWRAQREAEAEPWSPTSITSTGRGGPHPGRHTDARFAALASQPYEALSDTDRAWLVAENTAQQVARESQRESMGVAGGLILLALGVAAAVGVAYAYGISHSSYPL